MSIESSADKKNEFSLLVDGICDPFMGREILVLGDAMLDRYLLGAVRRISPEAPVPVVSLQREWTCPGGATNVAASVAALGAKVTFAGLVGSDGDGVLLRQHLANYGVADELLVEDRHLQTITKTRVLASDQHQLLRMDVDGRRQDYEKAAISAADRIISQIGRFKAICISDYDKGTLPNQLVQNVIAKARNLGVPCIVDPKKSDFRVYAHATILTPNVYEAERAVGHTLSTESDISFAAAKLRAELSLDFLLITRGSEGMMLAQSGPDSICGYPAEVRQVADVAGAGDTVVATLTACLASGWPISDACRLASLAAGIAVSRPGVYVVQAAEVNRLCSGANTKIQNWASAKERVRAARQAGQKIVFTNGCFDILHAGHVHCLEEARRLGDMLVVGLNSDVSVKLNKGEARPIIQAEHRAALLAALSCVDMVVTFNEMTPEALIQTLEPDVLVKGGDYDPYTMAGADFVRSRGGKVCNVPLLPGLSTTSILERTGVQ